MVKWIMIWGIATCFVSLVYTLTGTIPFPLNLLFAAIAASFGVLLGTTVSKLQKKKKAQQAAPAPPTTIPLKHGTLNLTKAPDKPQRLLPNGLAVLPPSLFLPTIDQLYKTGAQPDRLAISYKDDSSPARRTHAIIHPIDVTYFMRGKILIITEVTAFDETKNDTDSFAYRDILSATDTRDNQPISNLGLTLLGKDFRSDK